MNIPCIFCQQACILDPKYNSTAINPSWFVCRCNSHIGVEVNFTLVENEVAGIWLRIPYQGKIYTIRQAKQPKQRCYIEVRKMIKSSNSSSSYQYDYTLCQFDHPLHNLTPENAVDKLKTILTFL